MFKRIIDNFNCFYTRCCWSLFTSTPIYIDCYLHRWILYLCHCTSLNRKNYDWRNNSGELQKFIFIFFVLYMLFLSNIIVIMISYTEHSYVIVAALVSFMRLVLYWYLQCWYQICFFIILTLEWTTCLLSIPWCSVASGSQLIRL